jgi:hypothetical protein
MHYWGLAITRIPHHQEPLSYSLLGLIHLFMWRHLVVALPYPSSIAISCVPYLQSPPFNKFDDGIAIVDKSPHWQIPHLSTIYHLHFDLVQESSSDQPLPIFDLIFIGQLC